MTAIDRLYDHVTARLPSEQAEALNALLAKPPGSVVTGFNRLKQAPGLATPKTVGQWTERLKWLGGLPDPGPPLDGIAHAKLRWFAAEAAALEVGDVLDIAQHARQQTLLCARASRRGAGKPLSPSAGREPALTTGARWRCARSFTSSACWRRATSTSRAPRPSPTTAPRPCPGRSARNGCPLTARRWASPSGARASRRRCGRSWPRSLPKWTRPFPTTPNSASTLTAHRTCANSRPPGSSRTSPSSRGGAGAHAGATRARHSQAC